MKLTVSTKGSFENSMKWLNRVSDGSAAERVAVGLGDDGVKRLRDATPKNTGETANSWRAIVSKTPTGLDVGWVNIGHPGLGVNIAVIKELGHGTGTGGYVPPNPYIKGAMNPIWAALDKSVIKEMTK